jgi:hypothetical protein
VIDNTCAPLPCQLLNNLFKYIKLTDSDFSAPLHRRYTSSSSTSILSIKLTASITPDATWSCLTHVRHPNRLGRRCHCRSGGNRFCPNNRICRYHISRIDRSLAVCASVHLPGRPGTGGITDMAVIPRLAGQRDTPRDRRSGDYRTRHPQRGPVTSHRVLGVSFLPGSDGINLAVKVAS